MKRHMIEGLETYLQQENIPWHMPGHKRKGMVEKTVPCCNVVEILSQIEKMDVTEVPGLDDLHNPQEMIAASMDELKKIYKTYGSYYLVNGSTCGLLAAIATVYKNESQFDILIAENCHKSVYYAVDLLGLHPCYVKPQKAVAGLPDIRGSILPEDVELACKNHPEIRAAVITSPTYEGVVSDIRGIAEVLKKYGVYLIVDEAHGAHLPFVENTPKSAIYLGADLVVQSLHKTLPALTQTAVLHNQNPALDEGIRRYLSVFMSSSPSYVLLCSMEQAVAWASEADYHEYMENLKWFRKQVAALKQIKILDKTDVSKIGAYDYDDTRIVLSATYRKKKEVEVSEEENHFREALYGVQLEKLLSEKGNIVCEMSGMDYAVLISTARDTREDFEHLYETLSVIDNILSSGEYSEEVYLQESSDRQERLQQISTLLGKAAKRDIYMYPPGIPIIKEGEVVGEEKLEYVKNLIKAGKYLQGI